MTIPEEFKLTENLTDPRPYTGFTFKNAELQDRVICFIDLMPFEEYISTHDVKTLLSVLNRIKKKSSRTSSAEKYPSYSSSILIDSKVKGLFNEFYKKKAKLQDFQVTTFSDLVVLSFRYEESEFHDVFNDLESFIDLLSGRMLSKGLFCRGGVTIGKLYHDSEFCVGTGLVEAHNMEYKEAGVPRVIYSRSLVEAAKKSYPVKAGLKTYLYQDGYFGYDVLNNTLAFANYSKEFEPDELPAHTFFMDIVCCHEIIDRGLNSENPKIVERTEVLAFYLNKIKSVVNSKIVYSLSTRIKDYVVKYGHKLTEHKLSLSPKQIKELEKIEVV